MHPVIDLLAPDLGHELRQRREGRVGQRLESDGVGFVVQVAAGDGEGPVGARVVEQAAVA